MIAINILKNCNQLHTYILNNKNTQIQVVSVKKISTLYLPEPALMLWTFLEKIYVFKTFHPHMLKKNNNSHKKFKYAKEKGKLSPPIRQHSMKHSTKLYKKQSIKISPLIRKLPIMAHFPTKRVQTPSKLPIFMDLSIYLPSFRECICLSGAVLFLWVTFFYSYFHYSEIKRLFSI